MPTTLPASAEQTWDGSLDDMPVIDQWIQEERQRLLAGGQPHPEGKELDAFRQAAAMPVNISMFDHV
ncbi:hypothetical protein EI77_01258 [Prosthecobacter fusiformis]|uniref:Uncharacterized protein n=1 Tax=Prosthecobacter fusiformis TaxID=48464 RepID=A0A4V3FG07_9BACT|nr:hypothetical protein [Prosthecobacter fusiformis]TDU72793.1 hypothetical protein EI77_01258 [Prosthecobacter fusiformis]